MVFEEKFIAFIDVIGFKSLVDKAELGGSVSLEYILTMLEKLGSKDDLLRYGENDGLVFSDGFFVKKDFGAMITQISDCAIISFEVSPAGAISIVERCWLSVMNLLNEGFICRGYITKGSVYHTEGQVIGSGYQRAYSMEPEVSALKLENCERGTPYVEIDPFVVDYIYRVNDKSIIKMFKKMTFNSDGQTVIYPFSALSPVTPVSKINEAERNSNIVKKHLARIESQLKKYAKPGNEKAHKKARHYLKALQKQVVKCDSHVEIANKAEIKSPWSYSKIL